MAKYTDKEIKEAWQDFHQHLIDIGFLAPTGKFAESSEHETQRRLIHMAFKQGYVEGVRMAEEIAEELPVKVPPIRKEDELQKEIFETKAKRTKNQIEMENITVESILKANIFPMKLADIMAQMHEQGFKHWNNSNACSFVKHAINSGMAIEKVSNGIYSYMWKGQK